MDKEFNNYYTVDRESKELCKGLRVLFWWSKCTNFILKGYTCAMYATQAYNNILTV